MTDAGLRCAVLARTLVSDPGDRDAAFLAGMLTEIGQLVLGGLLGTDYGKVRAMARDREWALEEAEAVALGITHAQAGAHLLASWNLPETIVEAVRRHHDRVVNIRPIGPTEAAVLARRTLDDDDAAFDDPDLRAFARARRRRLADPAPGSRGSGP